MTLKCYIGFLVITAWNWGTWAFLINIAYPVSCICIAICHC